MKLRILVVGVGGQGILLFSRVLGETLLGANIDVAMSEVHGMAQRGGVVETNIVVGLRSPLISEKEADVLVGLEPVETLRALVRTNKNTTIITNTEPVIPQIVKEGLASYPDLSEALDQLKAAYRRVYTFAGESLARQAGTSRALNMVALGALAASGVFSLPQKTWENTIKRLVKPKYVEANLKAFDLGWHITS